MGEVRSAMPYSVGIAARAVQGMEKRGGQGRRHVGPGIAVSSPSTGPGRRSVDAAQHSITPCLSDPAVCPALRCSGDQRIYPQIG